VKGFVAESGVEEVCLDYFSDLSWKVSYGPDIAPDDTRAERSSYRDVLLEHRLRTAIGRLNPSLTASDINEKAPICSQRTGAFTSYLRLAFR
jgi:type I restriction enzyme R subunit